MKNDVYTEIICKGFCRFYKEGKEELSCGTYAFLFERFTPEELSREIRAIRTQPEFSHDEQIRKLICERCGFIEDGCDFIEGLDSPPCGGYTIVEWLLNKEQVAGKKGPSAE